MSLHFSRGVRVRVVLHLMSSSTGCLSLQLGWVVAAVGKRLRGLWPSSSIPAVRRRSTDVCGMHFTWCAREVLTTSSCSPPLPLCWLTVAVNKKRALSFAVKF
ncbi:hypothetical protein VPH35_077622 [Triticum aestivum]